MFAEVVAELKILKNPIRKNGKKIAEKAKHFPRYDR